MTTRAALRTRVQNIVGRTDTNSTTIIDDALDEALTEISLRHPFRELRSQSDLSIVADDLLIALPTGTFDIVELRLIDGVSSYPLILKSKKWVTELYPNIDADSTGKPELCYKEGSNLYLQPQCDGSYTIRITVLKLMDALDTDSEEPEVTSVDRAIVALASSIAFMSFEQFISSERWEAKFERALIVAIIADERRIGEDIRHDEFDSRMVVFPPNYVNDPFFKWKPGYYRR